MPVTQPAYQPIIKLGSATLDEREIGAFLTEFTFSDSISSDSALNELVLNKRYFLDARQKGYSADKLQQEELQSYTHVLSKSFLIDSSLVNPLTRLTYSRLKKDIRASHILLNIPPDAAPKDTSLIYSKITYLRSEILKGASFDSLAKIYSADINTKDVGGDMGWFTALQLLFPLENAAYQTAIGETSKPVRTNAGYHLIKVTNSRNSTGRLRVQHILKAVPPKANFGLDGQQKAAADSLYQLLRDKPSRFDELCRLASDDPSSKNERGFLPPFAVGEMEEAFEQVVFALQPGQISAPFRSSGGWHIVRLVEKLPLQPYIELREKLNYKVATDSRGEFLEEQAYARLADRLQIVENQKVLNEIFLLANAQILNRKWKVNRANLKQETLLKIAGEAYSNYSFIDFAESQQAFEKQLPNYSPEMYLRKFYKAFRKEKLGEAVGKHLKEWNADFKKLIEAYEEGMVVSRYLNNELYEKSVSDTVGQRQFYEKHLRQYTWPKQAKATIVRSTSDSLINLYQKMAKEGPPYRLKRGIVPFYYQKNEWQLTDALKRKLAALMQIMVQNPGYIVEIGGNRDVNEDRDVSAKRIQTIVKYLISNGLNIIRLTEYDYGTAKLADPFDWPQNQRITFQFFSRHKRDLAKILHSEKKSFEIAQGNYTQGENEFIDQTSWEIGHYEATFGNLFYSIEIEGVLPTRVRTLKEARGQVIADYQSELKHKMDERLAKAYPLSIDQRQLDTIFKRYKTKELK